MHNANKINDQYHLVFQVKTVPRVGEQPPRPATTTGAAAERNQIVARPRERQVCALLRNLLRKDRGSNWLTRLLFGGFGCCCRKPQGRVQRLVTVRFFLLPAMHQIICRTIEWWVLTFVLCAQDDDQPARAEAADVWTERLQMNYDCTLEQDARSSIHSIGDIVWRDWCGICVLVVCGSLLHRLLFGNM